MSDYTISYSRQKQLEKEEILLDEEVNKAKVVNQFDGTTLEKSLKELDECGLLQSKNPMRMYQRPVLRDGIKCFVTQY